jgi:hypothetical protein
MPRIAFALAIGARGIPIRVSSILECWNAICAPYDTVNLRGGEVVCR